MFCQSAFGQPHLPSLNKNKHFKNLPSTLLDDVICEWSQHGLTIGSKMEKVGLERFYQCTRFLIFIAKKILPAVNALQCIAMCAQTVTQLFLAAFMRSEMEFNWINSEEEFYYFTVHGLI